MVTSPAVLQFVEVLGDCLAGGREAMLHREPAAQLEQRLPVAVAEFVEDVPPCGVGQRLEDITHGSMIGKRLLACQCVVTGPALARAGQCGLVRGRREPWEEQPR